MYICAATLDDLLVRVFSKLVKSKNRVTPSRGETAEEIGVLLRLANPRARLSRTESKGTIFSCLGELLWYLAKTRNVKFITHYIRAYRADSEDGRTVYGGYGPRLFKMDGKFNQVENVLALLRRRPSSRRAVIQLFDASDIAGKPRKEVPCTCTLQFMIRNRKLHMTTNMRSNDAYLGLPHDVFCFTMLQEVFARSLDVELGNYFHSVGSLHLYDRHIVAAQRYLEEGWQDAIAMPSMPVGDPWNAIADLLKSEATIRNGKGAEKSDLERPGYWGDLVRLLQIHWHAKRGDTHAISQIKKRMWSSVFNTYIQKKQRKPSARGHEQLPLEFSSPGDAKRARKR